MFLNLVVTVAFSKAIKKLGYKDVRSWFGGLIPRTFLNLPKSGMVLRFFRWITSSYREKGSNADIKISAVVKPFCAVRRHDRLLVFDFNCIFEIIISRMLVEKGIVVYIILMVIRFSLPFPRTSSRHNLSYCTSY